MSVSKRTRYEVLRRDNHTCRYCGGAAPDVKLTVDHVTPVALGGTDDPSNLVAACRDCNAGKSSSAPDSSLVADVKQDALRHAEMIRQAYAVLVERISFREDYVDEFVDAFQGQSVPNDWRDSIGRWYEMGVPIEIVVDAAEKAVRSTSAFQGDGRFRYLCGIVWNQVSAVTEAVELRAAIDGAFMTDDALTNERIDAHHQGWVTGHERGLEAGRATFNMSDIPHRLLQNVIEGTGSRFRSGFDEWRERTA